jgi:hypothetical protein
VSRNVLHSCKTTTTKEEEPLRPRRAKTPTPPPPPPPNLPRRNCWSRTLLSVSVFRSCCVSIAMPGPAAVRAEQPRFPVIRPG